MGEECLYIYIVEARIPNLKHNNNIDSNCITVLFVYLCSSTVQTFTISDSPKTLTQVLSIGSGIRINSGIYLCLPNATLLSSTSTSTTSTILVTDESAKTTQTTTDIEPTGNSDSNSDDMG